MLWWHTIPIMNTYDCVNLRKHHQQQAHDELELTALKRLLWVIVSTYFVLYFILPMVQSSRLLESIRMESFAGE